MSDSVSHRGKRIQDLIEESKTDPKNKESLDRAYQRVKEWIEDWKNRQVEKELEEDMIFYKQSVDKEK